jgi:hypothetical protein
LLSVEYNLDMNLISEDEAVIHLTREENERLSCGMIPLEEPSVSNQIFITEYMSSFGRSPFQLEVFLII